MLWDRSESLEDSCECGAYYCVGTKKGFKFLNPELQKERKFLSWKRGPEDANENKQDAFPGEALAPIIRVNWRKESKTSAPDTPPSPSSSEDE
jgi:hypothetical protein